MASTVFTDTTHEVLPVSKALAAPRLRYINRLKSWKGKAWVLG